MAILAKLIKSKTMQGIAVAAIGAAIPAAELAFPEYVAYYKASSAILEAAGLGWATYGRVNAKGPIASNPEK